jgi:hypothetical protein
MKIILTFSIVLLSCLHALAAVAFEAPRQAGELSCLRLLTLKDIYDSGFRPYRVGWGLCCVGKADIRLKLPGVNQFVPFGVDSVSFSIDKNDAVTRIDIMTPGMPVEQAGAMINELVRSLNSVPQGLDEALARATIDNPKWAHATWTQDWSNEWASGRIGFEPLTYYVNDASKGYLEMKAIVHVGIKWNKTEIGPTYRETPVTPPKGYEHISMEIPSSDVVKKAQSSDDPSLAHLRHRDEKIRQAILESRPRSTQASALKKVSETSTSPTQSEEQASTTPWSVIVVSIVAALGLVWLWLRRRSRV